MRILNAIAPNHQVAKGVDYGTGARHKLDIYRPEGAGPFPVVVFLYGGSWREGSRSIYPFLGDALAQRGFITVIPDYRVFPEVRYPEFLTDCAQALDWTLHNIAAYGGQPGPCWLMGHSAGAYNAAMLTLDAQWLAQAGQQPKTAIRGMIGLAGPYDFLPLTDPKIQEVFATADPLSSSQPIQHVDGTNPPMLLLAGNRDTTVDPNNTTRLADRIRAAGGPVQDRIYAGVDHIRIVAAFSRVLRGWAPTLEDSVRFMRA